jgi:murein L,D-transpeptidase YafK
MEQDEIKAQEAGRIRVSDYLNKGTIRTVIFMTSGIIVFLVGVIVYGIILNSLEEPLSKAMFEKGLHSLQDVNIIIDRRSYTLKLYEDTILIKTYRASFGRNLLNPKSRVDDNATPVGEYKICDIDTIHYYYKFLKLNYPNINDAAEALRKGLITQREYDQLKFQFYYEGCVRLKTILGNNVGIHGIGRLNYIFKNLPFVYNWTDGSIALSNENIDEIYSVIEVGTKVVIK